MTEPTVCAIMLTADRPELARRAVACFEAQTYPVKRLNVLDSGLSPVFKIPDPTVGQDVFWRHTETKSIGELRNLANEGSHADILIHFDDDDYSHPNRIAEQVALLQSSGADAVGYNEMLFWRGESDLGCQIAGTGEAWLYSNPRPNYAPGTSLCYWRKTWERRPFAALPLPGGRAGEDQDWIDGIASGRGPGVKLWSVSSFPGEPPNKAARRGQPDGRTVMKHEIDAPRMIARIHGGNTSTAYDPALMRASEMQGSGWRRVPQWDEYCRSVVENR